VRRLTYIENFLPVTIEVEHAPDLTVINHSSIYCEDTGKVALNDTDYLIWKVTDYTLASLQVIIKKCQVVNDQYYRLMVSGDVAEALG
jgi:stage III sporulation protein SpoIIIAA